MTCTYPVVVVVVAAAALDLHIVVNGVMVLVVVFVDYHSRPHPYRHSYLHRHHQAPQYPSGFFASDFDGFLVEMIIEELVDPMKVEGQQWEVRIVV